MNTSILLILITTSVATSLLGVFLIIRKLSMMVDSISHTVLLGIVIAFIFIGDLSSPLLIVGATLMGIITVFLTEMLVKSKSASEDAATGLVFPLLFSIAIIIISSSFKGVHLDIDAVLLGKIEFAPFDKLYIGGTSIGPKLLYIMTSVMIINVVFIKIFFKELKLVSFDQALASTLGFAPALIHYLLMALVSLTSVTAFNAVGSILVVALTIGPAATALLLTKELKRTLFVAVGIGVLNSVLGYALALMINVNIAGMIATTTLLVFLVVFVFEPRKGVITSIVKKAKQKDEFAFMILVFHVFNHQNEDKEIHLENINIELNWTQKKYQKQIDKGLSSKYLKIESHLVRLTSKGKTLYAQMIEDLKKA